MKTWDDVVAAASAPNVEPDQLSLGSPSRVALRNAVILVERGDLTREQALCGLALGLLAVNEKQHEMLVEMIGTRLPEPILVDPGKVSGFAESILRERRDR